MGTGKILISTLISDILKSIEQCGPSGKEQEFLLPRGTISAELPDGWKEKQRCHIMLIPGQEMLDSYIHFFTERAKDIERSSRPVKDTIPPLYVLRRMMEDEEYIDRERLCVLLENPLNTGTLGGDFPATLTFSSQFSEEMVLQAFPGWLNPFKVGSPEFLYLSASLSLLSHLGGKNSFYPIPAETSCLEFRFSSLFGSP